MPLSLQVYTVFFTPNIPSIIPPSKDRWYVQVSIDSVLEKNNLDKTTSRHIPLKNFLKANELVVPNARRKLKTGKIIVLDGNFYLKKQIEHLIRNLEAPYYTFTLKASLETCIERDNKRKGKYGKDAATVVYNLVTKFDSGINIDTENKTSDQVANEILQQLPKSTRNKKNYR